MENSLFCVMFFLPHLGWQNRSLCHLRNRAVSFHLLVRKKLISSRTQRKIPRVEVSALEANMTLGRKDRWVKAKRATQEIWLPPQGQPQISCVSWGKGFNPWDSLLVQPEQRSILPPFFTLCVKPQVCDLPTGQPTSSRLQERGHSPKALQAGVVCSCRVPQCFAQCSLVWTLGL